MSNTEYWVNRLKQENLRMVEKILAVEWECQEAIDQDPLNTFLNGVMVGLQRARDAVTVEPDETTMEILNGFNNVIGTYTYKEDEDG